MPLYDRYQRNQLDTLVENYTQNKVGRRGFMQQALAIGLSASAATSLLAACGNATTGNNSTPVAATEVDVLNVWSSDEQASFQATVDGFTKQTGVKVKIEATRDLSSTLNTRLRGNNPPDIAILPNPGKMQELASQNKLVPLDGFLDMNQVKTDYSQAWIDLGSYNNKLYALFYKAANKGTIWYSPKQFQAQGYQVPTTWQDLVSLSTTIAKSGKYPWSMGVSSSGGSSGWPAADWIDQIYLSQSGPDMYDQWVSHKIKWTDPSVKQAFQTFGAIAHGEHYISGAPQSILGTDYQAASYPPFASPPGAYMYYLGDFTSTFITARYPKAEAGTDFNFFSFPTVNAQYAGAVTGGADVVVALKNTTAVQKLVQYMATARAQEIWVKRGGFISPNKSVDLSAYPNELAKNSADMLTKASIYRFGADDLMPSAVENAFWKATLSYIQTPEKLDSILSDMENTASQNYNS